MNRLDEVLGQFGVPGFEQGVVESEMAVFPLVEGIRQLKDGG
jgi:hypothetical protein